MADSVVISRIDLDNRSFRQYLNLDVRHIGHGIDRKTEHVLNARSDEYESQDDDEKAITK